nr:hypothetical protein [Tanacetum cinerariifolium]
MREKSKEENVNYDFCEIETKNVEPENSVAKLLLENERLCKEINHVKHVFKDQFDSIKKTRVRTTEHRDSLIDKLNLKSTKNEDLKAQIQDKAFVITSLKNDLQKLKGKEIVDIAAQAPYAYSIVPCMFKLDLEPLAPRITSANVVPPKKTTSHSVETQKPELQVYSRKHKNVKNVGSSKKAKIVEFKNANHSEPNHTWGSNATDTLSSSSLVMTGCPNCFLDSKCSKHMTGNHSQLMNFISKFLGTIRFGNDHIARIMRVAFVLDCVLSKSCVLLQKILRFATKDLAFCQDSTFCYKRSCVLSRSCVLLQKILRFVKILRFATKDHAFCQDPVFCYKRSCDSQMHNNIMAAGFRDRPPMLAPRRYPQWRSRFLRYVDTRPNDEALRKCILRGPYNPTTVLVHAVEVIDDSPVVPQHTTVETPTNMSPENKAHFLTEKEAIHLILTGIRDDIYSTVDACQTTQEMWEAVERLQQGESLNIQDVKTNLFWEFGKFTLHDGESMESYYTKFYKLMNEMIRNNLTVTTMQIIAPSPKPSNPSRSQMTTRHKGKEIAKPITPPSETACEEDNNPEQAQRDKDMQKNLALIAKQFGTQRTVNVAGTREKPKRVKDSAYHKEKMLLCKQAEQADSGTDSEQSEIIGNTCLVETDDSNVTPDSRDMCEDDIQNEQNDVDSDDERVALANLIANLKLDVDENKKTQKQLKKTKQAEFEKFKAFNDHTIDYDKLERKLNEALGQLAHKGTVIKEGLKTKAYELSVVKEKHDELMKHSLLTKSHYEGLVKQKPKVITDLKLREEHDIEKMLSMQKQLKFLNEVVYKRSQSIQTIHMMAPKVPTYNGRPTFAYPRYLKQAQSEISCFYAFQYDQSTYANRLIPDREETLALERECRSKLNKVLVRPYDYTKLNSLYEIFKPPT